MRIDAFDPSKPPRIRLGALLLSNSSHKVGTSHSGTLAWGFNPVQETPKVRSVRLFGLRAEQRITDSDPVEEGNAAERDEDPKAIAVGS